MLYPPAPRLPKTQQVTTWQTQILGISYRQVTMAQWGWKTLPSKSWLLDQSLCCNTVYNFQGLCCDSFGKWCIVYIRKSHILNFNTNINQVSCEWYIGFLSHWGTPNHPLEFRIFHKPSSSWGTCHFESPFFWIPWDDWSKTMKNDSHLMLCPLSLERKPCWW
jgi:hypothetical protein